MALKRGYTPSGIYAGSGVNPGGNIARSHTIHNGAPGSLQGGADPGGSARKWGPPKRPGPKPPAPAPVKPKPPGAVRPSNGLKPISTPVKQPSFTPIPPRPEVTAQDAATRFAQSKAQEAWDKKYGKYIGGAPGSPSAPPLKATPQTPAAPAKPSLGDASTHDAQYYADIARARYEYDLGGNIIADLRSQIEANKPKYQLGRFDLTQSSMRNLYDTNAALAARGLFRSGQRDYADTMRQQGYSRDLASLEQSYGGLAEKDLMAKINQAEAQRGIMDSVTGRWSGAMGAATSDAEAAALQRAYEQLSANPPAKPYELKPVDRKMVGWFMDGNRVMFRNPYGVVAPVPGATRQWLAKTKRAGV